MLRINRSSSVLIAGTLLGGIACSSVALADEGMWLPEQLPDLADELSSAGLQLSPEELSDLGTHPLGAVISLGGCSASFVSEDGLVVTNHHCAVGALQMNSTAEQNLLEDGFHAATREEEVWAGPGSRVYVTVEMSDVTEVMHEARDSVETDRERYDAMDQAEKALIAECEQEEGFRCNLASYYGGREYRLIRQLEIQDVRIVFAPPHMIGFYGGDEDNWMWPRHAGDFTFFRAYVAPDGTPAEYSEDNVPYEPEFHLEFARDGVTEGDFVMVAGYPGRTYRLRTASEFRYAEEVSYPWQIATMEDLLGILRTRAEEDEEAAVKLGSLIFGLANYRKNNQGTLDGFVSSGVVADAEEREARALLTLGTRSDMPGAEQWAADIIELNEMLENGRETSERDRLLGWMTWCVSLLGDATAGYRLAIEKEKEDDFERDAGYQERDWARLQSGFERTELSYDAEADTRLLAYFLRALSELPEEQRIEAVETALAEFSGEEDPAMALAMAIYEGTSLSDTETRLSLLTDGTTNDYESSDDPLIRLVVALEPLRAEIRERDRERSGAMGRLRPAYASAIEAAYPGPVYPDANGTLRVTFGLVRGYSPRDGVWYRPQTTVAGVLEKHTDEDPFDAPDELVEAIEAAEWGPYADPGLGTVPVDFLSDLDTTGGNSGSVTMNANGELVGLLFDGNYEAMASDWLFDTVNTRSIHVDSRYILWVLDYVYGAQNVIDELGF